jgi:hypothetical protein
MLSQKYDRFSSPSIADRRWKELVESSNRSHPFRPIDSEVRVQTFTGVQGTTYNMNYSSTSKIDYQHKTRQLSSIPPAGRPSFYRELLRPEVVDISLNSEYQKLLAEHMRLRQKEHGVSTHRS